MAEDGTIQKHNVERQKSKAGLALFYSRRAQQKGIGAERQKSRKQNTPEVRSEQARSEREQTKHNRQNSPGNKGEYRSLPEVANIKSVNRSWDGVS